MRLGGFFSVVLLGVFQQNGGANAGGTLGTHSSLHLTHHYSLALDFTRIADMNSPFLLL